MPKKGKKINKNHKIIFQCPKDGLIDRSDVDVWCNRCEKDEMVLKDGIYLCPDCLENMEGNFSCRICGSNSVKMGTVKGKKVKKD